MPNSAKIVAVRGSRRHLAHRDTAELDDVARFQLALLADPDHHQSRRIETLRRDNIEARSVLAGKAVRRRGAPHELSDRGERLLGRRRRI